MAPPEDQRPDDDLPDWEPLTPELVEDEAIRGDFMLRWAVVLLTLLFAWTKIDDSRVLVQIRSGEYMAGHGFLPPATDVFSATAQARPWINLSWLNDLVLAGVHGVAGPGGLTLLGAVVATIAFGILVHISISGLSTWWGSICAAIALVACFPLLSAGPRLWDVLGVVLLLGLVESARQQGSTRRLWMVVPLLLVWSSLSGQAFLGAGILLLVALGATFSRAPREDGAPHIPSGTYWKVAVAGLIALMIHPFHWRVLTAPSLLYGVTLPEIREYGTAVEAFPFLYEPVYTAAYWDGLTSFSIAAVVMAALSALMLLLNVRRAGATRILLYAGINAYGLLSGQGLALAALVNAVLATLNAQEFYRANFRQEYTVDPWELLYARGGRAATVLALFALGYFAISGRLAIENGRRVGVGFSDELAQSVEGYEAAFEDAYDDRTFNFRPSQGDLLIWVGQRPFVDSRLALYAGGDENLLQLHREVRKAVVGAGSDEDDPVNWRDVLDRYRILQAAPRLSGQTPDHPTFLRLLIDPNWAMTRLESSTAVFCRRDLAVQPLPLEDGPLGGPPLLEYLESHLAADFAKEAFRGDALNIDPTLQRPRWPSPPTFYDRYLWLRPETLPASIQLAGHYDAILSSFIGQMRATDALALAELVIRNARIGLAEDPDSFQGYRLLARAYIYLANQEGQIRQAFGGQSPDLLRQRQSAFALAHALICNPDAERVQFALFEHHFNAGRADLALRHLDDFERITGRLTVLEPDAPEFAAQQEQMVQLRDQLRERVELVRSAVEDALAQGAPRLQVVAQAMEQGCPGEALRVLEEDLVSIAGDVAAQLLHVRLLMEAGRTEDAWERAEALDGRVPEQLVSVYTDWLSATAEINLAADNYARSLSLWDRAARALSVSRVNSLLASSPMVHVMPDSLAGYPVVRSRLAADVALEHSLQWGTIEVIRAVVELEQGGTGAARRILSELLESDPETPLRPVAAVYLSGLTGEDVPVAPPSAEAAESGQTGVEVEESVDTPKSDEPMPEEPASGEMTSDESTGEASSGSRPPAPPLPEQLSE
ncbi:hypothetical protein [Maioricimonas sp. JC845]|uniref:tetratricopeptide repeat protein n=1 Tax=Maioricimonas sp. JC845 TaxID=3232138 RepID=UPI00345A69A1